MPVWEPRCRRQCLVTACVASKQLWCLFCVIWRACCPGSIQGFHTSLTHFSLPGFLLTGHKLSGGRGGLRSEKKISQDLISPVRFLYHAFGGCDGGPGKSFRERWRVRGEGRQNSLMQRRDCGFFRVETEHFEFIHLGPHCC